MCMASPWTDSIPESLFLPEGAAQLHDLRSIADEYERDILPTATPDKR